MYAGVSGKSLRLNKRLAIFASGTFSVPASTALSQFDTYTSLGNPPGLQFLLGPQQAFRAFNVYGFVADATDPATGFLSVQDIQLTLEGSVSETSLWIAEWQSAPQVVSFIGRAPAANRVPLIYYSDWAQIIGSSFGLVNLDLLFAISNSDAIAAHNINVGVGAIVELFDEWETPLGAKPTIGYGGEVRFPLE